MPTISKYPTVAATSSIFPGSNGDTWINVADIRAIPDDIGATFDALSNTPSAFIYGKGFGFSIPTDATINMVTVGAIHGSFFSFSPPSTVLGVPGVGIALATPLASGAPSLVPDEQFVLSQFNMSVANLTPSIINNANFYAGLYYFDPTNTTSQIQVDSISVSVTYTEVAPTLTKMYKTSTIARLGQSIFKL